MKIEIRCEICGGRLEAEAGGRFVCGDCGVTYSRARLRELAAATDAEEKAAAADDVAEAETAAEDAEAEVTAAADVTAEDAAAAGGGEETLTEKEERLRFLQAEQMRLLAEIRMADGVFGPSRRRELSRDLRRVEREIARLQGRKLPFFF